MTGQVQIQQTTKCKDTQELMANEISELAMLSSSATMKNIRDMVSRYHTAEGGIRIDVGSGTADKRRILLKFGSIDKTLIDVTGLFAFTDLPATLALFEIWIDWFI